jgi:hypothetical protein
MTAARSYREGEIIGAAFRERFLSSLFRRWLAASCAHGCPACDHGAVGYSGAGYGSAGIARFFGAWAVHESLSDCRACAAVLEAGGVKITSQGGVQ